MSQTERAIYQHQGLWIRSDWPLPGPISPEPVDRVDVQIQLGSVAHELPGACLRGGLVQAARFKFQLNMPGVARYRAEQGKRLLIEPVAGACERDVSLFLFHSVLPALLIQRGYLVLSACAVELPDGVALLCGHTASGKSALAATLHQRGLRVLGDDVVSLSVHRNQVQLRPGLPWLTVWGDVAAVLGLKFSDDQRSRVSSTSSSDRFQLELPSRHSGMLPIKRLVYLERDNDDSEESDSLSESEPGHRLLHHCLHQRFAMAMQTGGAAPVLAQSLSEQCRQQVLRSSSAALTRLRLEELADRVLADE